jgi:hypothetical protein
VEREQRFDGVTSGFAQGATLGFTQLLFNRDADEVPRFSEVET